MKWPFSKKAAEPVDQVAIQFASGHKVCPVHYDADGKPFVWILGDVLMKIDGNKASNPTFGSNFEVIWLRRGSGPNPVGEPK